MEKDMYRVYIKINIPRMQGSADDAMYNSKGASNAKMKLPDKVIDNQNMVDTSTPGYLPRINEAQG